MSKYYFIDEQTKQQCGPFPVGTLPSHNIRPETMVWCAGMADWQKASDVAELSFLFDKKIPVPQNAPQPVNNNIQQPRYNTGNQQYNPSPQPNNLNDFQKWGNVLPMPKTWLLESILLSIFCCSPVSVVGIVYASRVESLYYKQDFEGANHASKRAKIWTLSGILFLPAVYLLFFIFGMFLAIIGA